MTRNPERIVPAGTDDTKSSSEKSLRRSFAGGGGGSGTAMRIIVPLQGVVQGRGGLILGSFIPCALFYFFQLYLKSRPRSSPPSPSLPENLSELTGSIPRSQSRSNLSPRGSLGPAPISSRAMAVAKAADSAYYSGMRRYAEDPYDPVSNPDGVIELGLAENQVVEFLTSKMFFFF